MNRCIAIFGPTASGKSSLALRLADELKGVIISVDSMQIYRGMDIGTAKPSAREMDIIPHKMISICDPNESFSVYDFKKRAEEEIKNALQNKNVPILVGGTGLYFDALFFNTDFGTFDIKPEIRNKLEKELIEQGGRPLLERLKAIDPDAAMHLHEKDHKRIIRALEVYYSTGKSLTQFKLESHRNKSEFNFLKLSLVFRCRDKLYKRIDDRVDLMVKDGLVEEAKQVYESNLLLYKTASQAIGYKELVPYFTSERSLKECLDVLKQKTRNYAKRQITWFRRYEDAYELVMDDGNDPFTLALPVCKQFLKEDMI